MRLVPYLLGIQCIIYLGNVVQAVHTQCKLLYVGNSLNPSFGIFTHFQPF